MEQYPRSTSVPLMTGRAPVSTPLTDVQIFRPGPFIALSVLLLPVLFALIGAALSLSVIGSIPVWLPLVLLLWIPCLPLLWLIMKSVRITTIGLAIGKPWRTWQEIPWGLVERVEQHGAVIHLAASDGRQVSITPLLLRDGARLRRQLFLRLPPHVFIGALGQEFLNLFSGSGGLTGTLSARPRLRWYTLTSIVGALSLAILVFLGINLRALPFSLSVPLGVLSILVVAASIYAFLRLLQRVEVSNTGIKAWSLVSRRLNTVMWTDVALIEHSPHEAFLRLHGNQRLVCIGPGLLRPAQRDLMRAFIHEYCTTRDVPIARRSWVL